MIIRTLNEDCKLSEKDKQMIEEAKKMPIVYDDDCPKMTPEMEAAFREARRRKPYVGEPVTVYVMPDMLEKAKRISDDYAALFSRLLDHAIREMA